MDMFSSCLLKVIYKPSSVLLYTSSMKKSIPITDRGIVVRKQKDDHLGHLSDMAEEGMYRLKPPSFIRSKM